MLSFEYDNRSPRVVFGAGRSREIGDEIHRIGAARVLVLCTRQRRSQAEAVLAVAHQSVVGFFDEATMHVPASLARRARAVVDELGADVLVAIGGGSTVGLAKAVALETQLPIVAVATTYAGSEVTSVYGITDEGIKRTGRDASVLPRTVIYDPELTIGLPVNVTVTSAINAIAHAAEGLYAANANPISDMIALEGIRSIALALPAVVAQPSEISGRARLLYGAWMCGHVLNNAAMSLHHKLCHTLGGSFNLPHAEVHTVVLPHALRFNSGAASQVMARIAEAIGADCAAGGLYDLAKTLGAPVALKDIGMRQDDLDHAAELAVSNPYWNPRPVGPDQYSEIRALLQRAYDGRRP